MKVSIVIPALNEEKFIEAAIQSALAQDYPDVEVIVVDNGSTDRTVEIVKKFISVKLVSEPHRGLSRARETGRLKATGDIIAQMDADCVAPREWVSKGVGHLNDSRVVAVTGPIHFYDAPDLFNELLMPTQRYGIEPTFRILNALSIGAGLIGGNAFLRSSALADIGGYNTALDFHGEDADTGMRLAKLGKVIYRADTIIGSSARRFHDIGIATTLWRYSINFMWIGLFKKPFHKGAQYHKDR